MHAKRIHGIGDFRAVDPVGVQVDAVLGFLIVICHTIGVYLAHQKLARWDIDHHHTIYW